MKKKIRIFLAGDSTVASYGCRQHPMAGWGQALSQFFDYGQVEICNRAICGRSAKTFVREGRLERIRQELRPGDYLFIQFGHNDATIEKPERYCEPVVEFRAYLQQYIEAAREVGARPVLITPVQRRRFDRQGRLIWDHEPYIRSMQVLARQEQATLLDLSTISGQFFENMGPERTKDYFCYLPAGLEPNYPEGCQDDTHFQYQGACLLAELLVGEIEKSDLLLKRQLVRHKRVRVFMAGDSTMADYGGNEEPMAGWGQMLWPFFDQAVGIRNFAYCGKSSKSFWEDGYLAGILREIQAEDYLFIQFAHNDEKLAYDDPKAEFKDYLRKYILGARQRHAWPVLITPVERRSFDAAGRFLPTHEPYVSAIRELAAEDAVPLLDLNRSSRELLERLGPEASAGLFVQADAGTLPNYPEGHHDNTHFRESGATEIARLAVELLKQSSLDLNEHLI